MLLNSQLTNVVNELMTDDELQELRHEQAAANRIVQIMVDNFGELDDKDMMIRLISHLEREKDERKIEIFRAAISLIAKRAAGKL
ncbi:hypothetical protein CIG19_18895 [Enterobacterales bacterium CwR94]|nr:hypothetical protein CIG19_18895 [Enterobacterales bacterium CwR94]